MQIKEVNTKNVITQSKLPDADYVVNPFIGCQHACIYCYADFIKRFTGHSTEKWGEFVDVKINSADTIRSTTFNNKIILLGSVTDPYQQVEKKYEITRKILLRLLDFQPHLEILTKSGLILRDIELLRRFKFLRVGISIASLDSDITKQLEPNASTPSVRLSIVKSLKEANINSYLFVSPIFPHITDYKQIIENFKEFVSAIYFENLNIRSNNYTEILTFIKRSFPNLFDFYKSLPMNKEIWHHISMEINLICNNNNIPYKIYFDHSNDKK